MLGWNLTTDLQGVRRDSWLAHNPRLRAHYDRLVSRPERPLAKMTALGACMNKLLLWAFAVMKQRRPFELDHEWKECAA
jgi:hypothetical protein